MPGLSEFSLNNLNTCDVRLQNIVTDVAKLYNIRVLEGRRSNERQAELFASGKTKLGPGMSKHNPQPGMKVDRLTGLSLVWAVDLAPYPIDWRDSKRFVYLAGLMMMSASYWRVKLRWGGNWDMDQIFIDDQDFNDLPHYELVL